MKVYASIVKNTQVIKRAFAMSDIPDASDALMECLEQIYKELDVAEPVWVKKHALDLARYKRTRFLPEDFLETVDFDSLVIEYSAV
ncbi:MAG: hypothetical protein IJD14_00890 [Christensenellaceae bacterium]|nr:hypothetical protein [Christensenellaceae bacterium]